MSDNIDPVKTFKQVLIATGITPKQALMLAQAMILEDRATKLSNEP